jgi:hypothetical protein
MACLKGRTKNECLMRELVKPAREFTFAKSNGVTGVVL